MTEHTTLLGEKPKWWQWALLGLTILLALFLLWQVRDGFVLLWKQNTSALQFRFSLDYGEGPLLDQAVRLSRFENIYRRNIQEPPYTISNYPPIYPLLQVPFVWIFGPKLWYGRLISHLSILLTSIFIGLIIWKLSRNWIAAGMSGLSFLLVPYVFFWSTFARVDSLALMFSVAAMLVVVSAPDRRRNLIWGAVLLVAAIYTKQSYGFTAPFALFIFLLRDRPRKKAFELAGWSVLFGAVLFGLMQLVSKGGFFFHVFLANVNPFHWQMVRDYRDEIMEYFPFLIFFGFAYLVGGCWKRIRQPIWWLVAPYLLAASLVSITIGKEGSSVNYLYEFSTALALLIGALLSLGKGKQQWLQLIVLAAIFSSLTGMLDLTHDKYGNWTFPRLERDGLGLSKVERTMEIFEGNILADEHMAMVVTSGRPLMFQPFEYKMMVIGGLWDQTDFVRSIENQEYDLILLYDPGWDSRNGRWTPEQLEAIETYYRAYIREGNTLVYFPED